MENRQVALGGRQERFERLAHEANEHRRHGRHKEAAQLFAAAANELPQGVEGLEKARLLSLMASLDRDTLRYAAALDKLAAARRIYHLHGDSDGLANCEIKRGIALDDLGEHEDAKREFAAAWNRSPEDSDLRVVAVYNILNAEVCQGHFAEARAMFEAMRPAAAMMEEGSDPHNRRRKVEWAEAEILLGENKVDQARAIFREIASLYVDEANPISSCRVLVDLAECAVRLGDHGEASQIAIVVAELLSGIGTREAATVRKLVLARMSQRQYSEAVLRMLLGRGPRPCAV